MASGQAICGGPGVASDDAAAILEWVGIIGSIIGVALGIYGFVSDKLDDVLEVLDDVFSLVAPIFEFLLQGVFEIASLAGHNGLILVGSLASAGATFLVVVRFYYNRCDGPPVGFQACTSGVVEVVIPEFDSLWNEIFPFSAMHPRADVVVKSKYWNWTIQGAPPMVRCAACNNCPPEVIGSLPRAVCSPMLACYFHSETVCAAGRGSIIGGAIGALGGMVLGTAAGIAVFAACGVLTIFCLLAALLVETFVAAATTLIGAFIGGQIAKAAASEEEQPASSLVSVGAYITTSGNLISSGFVEGANAYWFVGWGITADEAIEDLRSAQLPGILMHGRSSGSPPFCYTDPDENISEDDGCPSG